MWFKAASLFQFIDEFTMTPEALEEALATNAYEPVNRRQLLSYGWVPPMGDDSEQLVHTASGFMLLKARREERILPASVIADHMAGYGAHATGIYQIILRTNTHHAEARVTGDRQFQRQENRSMYYAIRALSTTGKHVQKIGLTLNETVNFVLDDEFVFSKIKFVDTNPEDGADMADLDSRAVFDSNFSLMALEFSTLFPRLIEIFGGYKQSTDP